jgi:RNA polymerase sigma-70 factor (ECF subfamily)
VKPYERRIYAAAFAILRNESEAEDAAQEAVLKALTHIHQFRAEARFSTWLTQITVNEALMRRRKAHAEIVEPIGEREEDDGSYTPRDFADWREIPSEALHTKQLRQALQNAIAALAPKYREVLVLRDVDQLSISETAQALGISEANVKTRLLRARLQVRDALAPGFDGGWSFAEGNWRKVRPW